MSKSGKRGSRCSAIFVVVNTEVPRVSCVANAVGVKAEGHFAKDCPNPWGSKSAPAPAPAPVPTGSDPTPAKAGGRTHPPSVLSLSGASQGAFHLVLMLMIVTVKKVLGAVSLSYLMLIVRTTS